MAKAAKLHEIAIDQLIPYERNAKTHSPEQVEKIAASIREFGFVSPVLIDEQNRIIAGHGRVLAAKALEAAKGSIEIDEKTGEIIWQLSEREKDLVRKLNDGGIDEQ